MFDPFRIGYYRQNYKYHRKGSTLRKKLPRTMSQYYPSSVSELKKLLPLMYEFQLLSPLKDPDPPPPPPEEEEEEEEKPDPSPDPELISKSLIHFAVISGGNTFVTHPDIKITLDADDHFGFLYQKAVFNPHTQIITIPYNLWTEKNLPSPGYKLRTWLLIVYQAASSLWPTENRIIFTMPFTLPPLTYDVIEQSLPEGVTADITFHLSQIYEQYQQQYPFIQRFMDEMHPDRYIITYLRSVNGSALSSYDGYQCSYQILWHENFSDQTHKDFSNTFNTAVLYELSIPYTISSNFTAIDITEKRSNGESFFSQANVAVVLPSVLTGTASELPIM